MAGQPPEPSFQPSGQDPGMTQARPIWQPASYPPPPDGGQQGYGTAAYPPQDPSYQPQEPSYQPQEPSYTPQDQTYAAQDQTYTTVHQGNAQAQAQPQEYPGAYPGYQPPSYASQSGPGSGQGAPVPPPQWQGIANVKAPQPKQRGEKGFLGSLFDFSFSSFVTPKIIRVLYVLLGLWTALVAVVALIIGFRTGGWAGGMVTLIIVDPIFILLTMGLYRVILEAFMVVFRIYEEAKKIRENSASQPGA
jgi:hypothetical protein